ncbi:MAG TPA: tripartite tricarboxylate transporter substrate-binding protein [Stellaceae bacterium]|nr:tripartite tricarboxylate transporter substrate-binding protein [Stellaceae bacterium]
MQIGRRDFLAGVALAGSGLAMRPAFAAKGFPDKNINFIIPFAPGGGYDEYVRIILPPMQAQLPRSVVVLPVNVDGAAGGRAAEQLHLAKPDGYTISIMNVPGIIILQTQGGVDFDLRQLTWLCNMGIEVYGIAVAKDSPIKNIGQLLALAKKKQLKFPCVGPAGTAYSATRIGAHLLGFEAQMISGYRTSADFIIGCVRGEGDAVIASLNAMSQFIDNGMIRVLATFEKKSSIKGAEDATTLGHPDLTKIVALRPVAAPPHLPPDIAAQLSTVIINSMKDPKVLDWARKNRANMEPADAQTTTKLFNEQLEFITTWKKYVT